MPFIVFEGIDGSGTTTISKRVVDTYNSLGRDAIWTCEPTTRMVGRLFREIFEGKHGGLPSWRVMVHLIQADREMHAEWIRAALSKGQYVVCDRYWLSTLAYQSTSAGPERERAVELIQALSEHLPQPDVTIVLDVLPAVAEKRRNRPADLFEKNEFLEKVRQAYLQIRGVQVRRVDTMSCSVEEVYQLVDKQLKEAGH